MEKYIIQYKNKSINTKNWVPITEEELILYKNEYFKKPIIEEVFKQMKKNY